MVSAGELAPLLFYDFPDSSLTIALNGLRAAKSSGDRKILVKGYINFATILAYHGNISESISYLGKALNLIKNYRLGKKLEYQVSLAMGHNYFSLGNGTIAKKYYLKLLELFSDDFEKFETYRNIGAIYSACSQYDSAILIYRKAFPIKHPSINQESMAYIHNNVMQDFRSLGKFDSALVHQGKMQTLLSPKKTYSWTMSQLSRCEILLQINRMDELPSIFSDLMENHYGKFDRTDYEILLTQLRWKVQVKDRNSCKEILNKFKNRKLEDSLSNLYYSYKMADLVMGILPDYAKVELEKSYQLALRKKYWDELIQLSVSLAKFYKSNGDCEKMEYYLIQEKSFADTVNALEGRNRVESVEYKSMLDQRFLQDSIEKVNSEKLLAAERAKKDFEQKEELRKQRFLLYSAGGILFFLLFISFLLYRGFKRKKKDHQTILLQKNELQIQKSLVDEKQKEIIDSINYAKRLQQAILTPEAEILKFFPTSFLLYQPKDIVAGDFYFFENFNDHIFYAAADCTGHGVPGAMMSIVCSNALSKSVKEFGLTDPGQILDKTRELVVETFVKSGTEVKDGMDISLVVMAKTDFKPTNDFIPLRWAGANNPLWYFEGGEMKELKANKQPIGKMENPQPFSSHQLKLSSGTTLFLFTDGYADQFGGPKGKKFKYSNFMKILSENIERNPADLKG